MNISAKTAIALFAVLVTPAASFARGGGMAASGHVGAGRENAALSTALSNMSVDPSGIDNASRVTPIPPPRITVPTVPRFK